MEEIVVHISNGDLLDILEHPNEEKYSGQQIFIISINSYVYYVPFVEDDEKIDLLSVNYTGFLLGNLFVTSLIVLYLYYILQKNLDLNGYFIIMVGALFYYCGGFLLIGMIKIIATIDSNAARELYSINAVLNIFFYGFVLWGLIRKDRETKIPLSEPHRPFA